MKFLKITMGLFLAATLSFGLTANLEARSCKSSSVYGKGKGYTKNGAKSSARNKWRKNAKRRYGKKWSHYIWAKSKRIGCSKRRGKYRCTVRARPCKR